MADDIEIIIGGESVRVPRWATEETAREMSKFNLASAKALTELVKHSGRSQKTVADNQKILRDLKTATKQDRSESIKAEKKLNEFRKDHGKALQNATNSLKSTSKDLADAFNKESLSGIVKALIPIGAIGAAAGFAVSVLEEFAKNVSELSNVGIGLGSSLVELRHQATLTGLNMEDYGKLVMSNGDSLRAMGENAQDGAANFSRISREARVLARDFNNFGLTNTEYNEMLLEEIEIRRRSGMNQQAIQDGLAESMNNLLLETTGLAAITGQDRRDMIRKRREMADDPAITAFRMSIEREGGRLSENFNSLATVFGAGGEVGDQIGLAMAQAIATGLDFRTTNNEAVRAIASINSEANTMLQDIFNFVSSNMKTMDTSEFNVQLVSRLAELGDAIPADEMVQLGRLAQRDVDGAAQLISLVSELQGLEKAVETNREAHQDAAQATMETELLALASHIQETTNRMKDSTLSTVIENLGLDVKSSGGELVEAIRNISDNFGPDNTLWEGIKGSYSEMTTGMERFTDALKAAGVGLGLLSLTGPGRKMLGWGWRKTGGRMLGGAKNLLGRGSGAASGAGGLFSQLRNWVTRGAGAVKSGASAAASKTPGILSRFLPMLVKGTRAATPAGAFATGLGIKPTGDGTISGKFEDQYPFPTDGTNDEQLEWQRRRNEWMQREAQSYPALNTPFENNSILERTPGPVNPGSMTTPNGVNGIEANTQEMNAFLNNQAAPRIEDWLARQTELIEDTNRQLQRLNRTAEESQ